MIGLIFIQIKHPLAIGIILLTQTFTICLITGSLAKTFWFSYILFLVFLGGILVLFIYVTSLASNEIFSLSIKATFLRIIILRIFLLVRLIIDKRITTYFSINLEIESINTIKNFMPENSINLNKLYNFPTNIITLLLINYLFLTLIIIVKITNNFSGPLRNNN